MLPVKSTSRYCHFADRAATGEEVFHLHNGGSNVNILNEDKAVVAAVLLGGALKFHRSRKSAVRHYEMK